jgi:GDP-L-fucose synthase
MNSYYIAGNRGLIGSKMMEYFANCEGGNTSTINYKNYIATRVDISLYEPTHVIINAASVGGIQEDLDNSFSVYGDNISIQNNLLQTAHENKIHRVLLQGSGCSYPNAGNDQYFVEDDLMSGKPHPAYMPSAMCKLLGMEQIKAHNANYGSKWTTAINTNIFGAGERNGKYAHVIGALIEKFHNAVQDDLTEIQIWGSGNQTRDLLYVEDAITAYDLIINNDEFDVVNVSYGEAISIGYIADRLKTISGFTGRLWFNRERPEGVLHRRMDNTRLRSLGWKPKFTIEDALTKTYEDYMVQHDNT